MPFQLYEASAMDDSMNRKLQKENESYKGTMRSAGRPVNHLKSMTPSGASKPEGMMNGPLMKWTKILEAMDLVQNAMDEVSTEDPMDTPAGFTEPEVDDQKLLEELNKLFTPVLVMQGLEKDITDQANGELSESGVLTEKNVISFDNPTRMAQLIAVCAKLINREKNTPEWQAFYKAAEMKRDMALKMQKNEYDAAKTLAQKYLVMVSTTNTSSVARDAAKELLPQTQH